MVLPLRLFDQLIAVHDRVQQCAQRKNLVDIVTHHRHQQQRSPAVNIMINPTKLTVSSYAAFNGLQESNQGCGLWNPLTERDMVGLSSRVHRTCVQVVMIH
jgi:hypothetical protein